MLTKEPLNEITRWWKC